MPLKEGRRGRQQGQGRDPRAGVSQGLATHTEHLHVMPVPDLLHKGQWLPFGNWDGAKDNGAWSGQRLADRLNERLAEQLHLPNLINDAHAVPGAAAGTGLRTEGTVTGKAEPGAAAGTGLRTAEPCDLDPAGPTLTTHQCPQQGSCALHTMRLSPHARDTDLSAILI